VRRLVAPFVPLAVIAGWAQVFVACDGRSSAVDRGGACSFAADCLPGLVCVEQENGARVCTDDLTGALGDPPGQGDDDDGGPGDGEGGVDEDGGDVDATIPPDEDGGVVPDSGTPADAGNDADPPPVDAGDG
jgi:hypothetical protein